MKAEKFALHIGCAHQEETPVGGIHHVPGVTVRVVHRMEEVEKAHDMPGGLQAKLLSVLEDKTYKRLGGVSDVSVDIRVVAATNADLAKNVREGRFRTDLFYRLNTFPILILPLRERTDDIR